MKGKLQCFISFMAAAQATGQKAPTVSAQSLPLNAFPQLHSLSHSLYHSALFTIGD